jgi:pimeloyl-ACP methyl ester carboxylesterase
VADAYFPYDIQDDLRQLGLEYSVVPTRLGPVRVARSADASAMDTLFLHGAGLDSSAWSPLIRAAHGDERTAGWAFVDLPGAGGSADLERGLTLDEAGEAVLEVASALGADAFDLVGHSMGGFLALHLAARRADRVRSLTVVCGAYGTIVDVVNAPLRTLLRAPRATLLYLGLNAVARLRRLGRLALGAAAATGALRLSMAGVAAHPFRVPRSMLRALAAGNRPQSFLYAQTTGIGYDYRAVWSQIDLPVLAVFGDSDALVSRRDAQTLASALPAARIEYLAEAGHLAPMEQPVALLRLAFPSSDEDLPN